LKGFSENCSALAALLLASSRLNHLQRAVPGARMRADVKMQAPALRNYNTDPGR